MSKVYENPVEPLHQRYSLKHLQNPGAVFAIGLRHNPTSRPLEDEQLPHFRLNLRDDLDRACTSTNDSNTFVGEVVAVIPGAGVESFAGEG